MEKKKAPPVVNDINVTPMVDVMLVLLIIFMVITPMLTKGAQVENAKTKNAIAMQNADKEDAILVAITKDGRFYLSPGNQQFHLEDLTGKVRDLQTNKLDKTVYIKADSRAKYGGVEEVVDNLRAAVDLTAGAHAVSIDAEGDTSNDAEQIRLAWLTPDQRKANHETAIAAAKSARTVVIFAWTRGKPDFALPGDQNRLIEEIAAVNPNTIVVLNVSQPVALPWLNKVKAIVQMWWPGDEGGWATANILLGKTSPAGRLPFTWGKRLEDYAATDPAHPERSSLGVNGATTFSEGVNVGYRWFDKQRIVPLFPFAYGLSYTTFAYSALKTTLASDGGLDVSFQLKNSGSIAGDEVPQVYLGAPTQRPAGADFAVRVLAAFDRVHLDAGQSQSVTIHVPPRSLEYWSSADEKWIRAKGTREVLVGNSSRNLPLEASVSIQ